MRLIARIIVAALGEEFEANKETLLKRSKLLMNKYPLYV